MFSIVYILAMGTTNLFFIWTPGLQIPQSGYILLVFSNISL
ncbi:hypothetical protein SAMN05192553_10283 [Cyclobacterium xiamenense]|uniref:Uncharacterized protein n=1 Tax=Cyclobacterium xiamenense TaxID=1297121 RepID=A0A1H6VM51_9BACT|nr:hypothetical protein SAMN05192553_10283 [Cyclobacterium xiamenense]